MVPSPRLKVRLDSPSIEPINGVSPPNRSDETGLTEAASTAWKKPVEGEKPPAVMGASSWPALSLSSAKKNPISSQDDRPDSQVEIEAVSRGATLPESVAKSPTDDSLSVLAPSSVNEFSVESPQCDFSSNNASSSHPTTTSGSPGSEPDNSVSRPTSAGGVGPSRPGPNRSSRPHHNHRGHNSNSRYYTHQRGREHLNNNNSNTNYSRRHRNYSHESNPNRGFGPRHFPPSQPAHGLVDGSSYLLPPHLPPPPPYPYPPGSLPYTRAPLPPPSSGYIFSYNFGEPLYFPDVYNQWQFAQPMYPDVTGGIPTIDPSLHPAPFNSQPPPSSAFQSLANSQPETAKPQDESELCGELLNQIEYYFSDENLKTDNYLKGQMDDHGWVRVSLIAGFKRVKNKTDDIGLIIKALKPSARIEIQGDRMRRRGDWKSWINSDGSTDPHHSSNSATLEGQLEKLQIGRQ